MLIDKTIGHYHTDPKIVEQDGIGLYDPGTVFYLDVDGIYKPAIATSLKTASVAGFMWQAFGPNKAAIKVESCHLEMNYPYLPSQFFYNLSNGLIDPLQPKLPGKPGNRLYLSETEEGKVQAFYPRSRYIVVIGYRTLYGMTWRPEIISCCLANLL